MHVHVHGHMGTGRCTCGRASGSPWRSRAETAAAAVVAAAVAGSEYAACVDGACTETHAPTFTHAKSARSRSVRLVPPKPAGGGSGRRGGPRFCPDLRIGYMHHLMKLARGENWLIEDLYSEQICLVDS